LSSHPHDRPTPQVDSLSLHDALPISDRHADADAAYVEGARHLAAGENARFVEDRIVGQMDLEAVPLDLTLVEMQDRIVELAAFEDRKSTRLNSSHVKTSYAVFCLKKK